MCTYRVRRATDSEFSTVSGLIGDVALWLRSKGTDQWQKPWPSAEGRDARIMYSLRSGKTWLVKDGNDVPAATITVEDAADPKLWNEWESAEPAVYVHRLVVGRGFAGIGLGAALLNWAGKQAADRYDAKWIRIDVWTTNAALHRYYERQGFSFVRECADAQYPSSALFRRSTSDTGDGGVVELIVDRHRGSRPDPGTLRFGPRRVRSPGAPSQCRRVGQAIRSV